MLRKSRKRGRKILAFEADRALYLQLQRMKLDQRRSYSFVIRELLQRALAQNEKTA